MALIKCIYRLSQYLSHSFKEYITTVTLKELFNQFKIGTCVLYIVKKLNT